MEKEKNIPVLDNIKEVKNASLLEAERKLKRIHVVIRKIQGLVPGAHELAKFNVYANCLTSLNQLRSLHEEDRQSLVEIVAGKDANKTEVQANDISQ